MAIHYQSIVPWGRNLAEYVRMFDLGERELRQPILGCGDGPASFNAECTRRGGQVVSVDPLYCLAKGVIERCIQETYADVLDQTRRHQDKFCWDDFDSVEALGKRRMAAMQLFLASYEEGKRQGRYIPAALPHLPFPDHTFALALSSHFLFLYTDNLTHDFHVAAIREMLRVADEVRIFPLLDVNAQKSSYLSSVLETFGAWRTEIRRVKYEFQRGGNEMLVIGKLSS